MDSSFVDVVGESDLVIVVKCEQVVVLRPLGDLMIEAPEFEAEIRYALQPWPWVEAIAIKPKAPDVEVTGEAIPPAA